MGLKSEKVFYDQEVFMAEKILVFLKTVCWTVAIFSLLLIVSIVLQVKYREMVYDRESSIVVRVSICLTVISSIGLLGIRHFIETKRN